MQTPREIDVDSQSKVGGVQPRPHHGNRAGNLLPPEVLTDAEVRSIMKACNLNRITGARNAALIVVLYRCGLRISEVISLQVKDVDLQSGCIRILRGKGGRSRTVGIDPAAATILALWMRLRTIMMQGVAKHSPQVATPANATPRPAQTHHFSAIGSSREHMGTPSLRGYRGISSMPESSTSRATSSAERSACCVMAVFSGCSRQTRLHKATHEKVASNRFLSRAA